MASMACTGGSGSAGPVRRLHGGRARTWVANLPRHHGGGRAERGRDSGTRDAIRGAGLSDVKSPRFVPFSWHAAARNSWRRVREAKRHQCEVQGDCLSRPKVQASRSPGRTYRVLPAVPWRTSRSDDARPQRPPILRCRRGAPQLLRGRADARRPEVSRQPPGRSSRGAARRPSARAFHAEPQRHRGGPAGLRARSGGDRRSRRRRRRGSAHAIGAPRPRPDHLSARTAGDHLPHAAGFPRGQSARSACK